MIRNFCDICGREFKNYSEIEHYKIKKEEYCFHESWWSRLDVHRECWLQVCKSIEDGFDRPIPTQSKEIG